MRSMLYTICTLTGQFGIARVINFAVAQDSTQSETR